VDTPSSEAAFATVTLSVAPADDSPVAPFEDAGDRRGHDQAIVSPAQVIDSFGAHDASGACDVADVDVDALETHGELRAAQEPHGLVGTRRDRQRPLLPDAFGREGFAERGGHRVVGHPPLLEELGSPLFIRHVGHVSLPD
jgi:hypothetical protein